MVIRYSVPPEWYEGVFHDGASPCSAARPFSLLHSSRPKHAVLLIHGYAGYPGELVRPARDLYDSGFDCYVPRLPGCGTTGEDFMRSRRRDWKGVACNALGALNGMYERVDVVGHSMGASLAIEAAKEEGAGRLVLAAPAVAWPGMKPPRPHWQMRLFSLVRKRIPTPWHHQDEFVMHYDGAPCDDDYLGGQYWSWVYIRQIDELYSQIVLVVNAFAIAAPTDAINTFIDTVNGAIYRAEQEMGKTHSTGTPADPTPDEGGETPEPGDDGGTPGEV